MGIYPTKDTTRPKPTDDGGQTWEETTDDYAVKRTRTVIAGPWREERYNCFCCTCEYTDAYSMSDAYCRNHGFAGERPCDIHNMPGQPDDDDKMPMPVGEYRKMCDARSA